MALPRPQLKGMFWRHYKTVWFSALAAGATGSVAWYYYQAHVRDKFRISRVQQVQWDAVAAVMFKKAEWEDDWEAAVKKVFNTSENKNLDLVHMRRCLEDAEQNYLDKYDLPVNYEYKGLHENCRLKPWQMG
ncbi:uncharacterized protein LOC142338532 [Convolutriloba macropyga]|uniref:uncharacterized protein LOC142338532 n=1 Tax=Convolutriloba macropyga TaxID=536237 RepID=UPI003F51C868